MSRGKLIPRFSFAIGALLFACDAPTYSPVIVASSGATPGADTPEPCGSDGGEVCSAEEYCQDGRCARHVCGDGRVGAGEQCDDGNQDANDSCTPSCVRIEEPCLGDACDPPLCGDGIEDSGEECDDGNRVDDDQCSNVCSENRCRNGRIDPGEECDDGNQIHDDGCSNSCVVVVCGNARTEDASFGAHEECDDGNRRDDDQCANACTRNECGNLRVDPGEVCDGDTVDIDCADDCRSTSVGGGACAACRAEHCANFQDAFDLVGACFDNPDPAFTSACAAVMDCAFENDCGYDDRGGTACFCGSVELNACQTAGAADGPCQNEWFDAARTRSLAELIGRFGDVSLPSGVALYLLECDRNSCPACLPN